MKYRMAYKIRGHEICPDYLLNRIFIMHYYNDCFANYCTDHKIAAFDLQKENKTWIMTEIKIDFSENMPRWRETVELETWTRKISALRTEQDFYVFHNKKILAKGTSRWVVINETTRKPFPYKNLSKIFECIDEEVFPKFNFKKFKNQSEYDFEQINKIRTEEVDFNMHLNSIKYITKAIDVIPQDFKKEHTLQSFQAKYSHESLAGDILKSVAKQDDKLFKHQLNKKTEEDFVNIFNMVSEWK